MLLSPLWPQVLLSCGTGKYFLSQLSSFQTLHCLFLWLDSWTWFCRCLIGFWPRCGITGYWPPWLQHRSQFGQLAVIAIIFLINFLAKRQAQYRKFVVIPCSILILIMGIWTIERVSFKYNKCLKQPINFCRELLCS